MLGRRALRAAEEDPATAPALWRLLSAGKLGVTFRRQVPLGGRYIADFLAPSVRLIVEVDGVSHLRRAGSDARRDRALRTLGYRVLRVPASLVMHHPAATVALIQAALRERTCFG